MALLMVLHGLERPQVVLQTTADGDIATKQGAFENATVKNNREVRLTRDAEGVS
jgi:hypothetical protein